MEKMNWFCENQVLFIWKYWMTLHATWIQFKKFNWISINLNSNEKNEMQIGTRMCGDGEMATYIVISSPFRQ